MAKKRQGKGAGRALLIAGITLAGVGAGFGLVMANRDKLPANVREFQKRYTNPRMLRSAASGGRGNLGIVFHNGRKSGREYATPVRIDPIPNGFLVPLPYGTDTDWLKNILAAGEGRLRFRGQDIAVNEPEIIDTATALAMLPPSSGIAVKILRVKQFLRLRRATTYTTLSEQPAPPEEHPAQQGTAD
jgi:deazaflavin-dependent oxidoreductase (nitroreductase family)